MAEWLQRIQHVPWVAHLVRANTRFTSRLGTAFAGSITYFSVLALVPIAMVAFAVVSFVYHDELQGLVDELLPALGPDLSEQLRTVLVEAQSRAGVAGVIGLVTAAYAGAGWMGQMKSAVRAQWRPSLDEQEERKNFLLESLLNLLVLLALVVLVGATFLLTSVATSFADDVMRWLGLQDVPGIGWLLRLVPLLGTLLFGFVLFLFLYRVLPQQRISTRMVLKGSAGGAVGLLVLQYLSSVLFGLFRDNVAAATFGPVIVLMLFLNLFARLILFVAAWIATSEQRAIAGERIEADLPLEQDPDLDLGPVKVPAPEPERGRSPYSAQQAWARRHGVRIGPQVLTVQYPDEKVQVPQPVAVRATRIASAVGWLLGAATGAGLGASLASSLRRRRRD
ncbi:hypothetical protein GC722_07140 [Auraticoccus sp. F435]|uniref:Inner membrane protein YhjD n=1 Tax=Auraticoccus cholistanensis TaxID=2656650 RepID=A0A6A9US98_9ACTN|nr:YhjD/YihY/BrkB family envelope integrity protein [Auraticoccus cholistanensis]MVA75796.1 hypothetical protein [Auraticoccus cholistanensis]